MYLDTDVILSVLKDEDWLKEAVSFDELEEPKTSLITALEIQLIYFDKRDKDFIAAVPAKMEDMNIEVLPLKKEPMDEGGKLLTKYDRLNLFDSIHLGHSLVLEEPIVSTDTLYPDIKEIEHIDPREL